jgi:hypothetical protein
MEPMSSPQSGRSAREAARPGADAIQRSRFLGPQEPRPLAGNRKAITASGKRPPAPKARSAAAVTCEREEWGRSRRLRGCPWLSARDRSRPL